MNPQKTEQDTLLETLDLARLAPSIHNSQPWRWRVEPRAVRLYADLRRWLPVTDQDGRDLMLSCGAALHHLRVALAASGIAARVRRLPDPDERDLLAVVEVDPHALAEPGLGSVEPLYRRRTDRRRFNPWPVPQEFLNELVQRAAEQGAVLRAVSDLPTRRKLVAAIAQTARAQAATPGYPEETAAWSGRTDTPDGIPTANTRAPIKRARRSRCAISATAPSSNRPTPRTGPCCWLWAPRRTTTSPSCAPARR